MRDFAVRPNPIIRLETGSSPAAGSLRLLTGLHPWEIEDDGRNLPPVMNDDGLLDRTIAAVRMRGGDISEIDGGFGAEDFAFFSERVPSSHIRIGSSQPGRQDRVHNSNYQPDESCIAHGVLALSRTAMELLNSFTSGFAGLDAASGRAVADGDVTAALMLRRASTVPDGLPRDPMAKVLKNDLREPFAARCLARQGMKRNEVR
jgi:hypothetical protein